MKPKSVFKIKCQCGHVNLIPVTEVFHVYENIKCEKCGKAMAEPKELIEFGRNIRVKHIYQKKERECCF